MRPWLVCAVALAACSSRPHVVAPGFASGTRLAARYDDLGGTLLFRAFYDSARDEECAFRAVPDGGAVCLPQSAWLDGWFADADCSEPVVEIPRVPAGRSPPRELVTDAANGCASAPTVRALGDAVPGPQGYYVKSDGSCVQNPPGAKIVLVVADSCEDLAINNAELAVVSQTKYAGSIMSQSFGQAET